MTQLALITGASRGLGFAMAEALAVSRGIDPDTPRHLNKVTETV